MICFLLVIAALSLAYWYYWREFKNYECLFDVPGPRGSLLFGSALDFKGAEDVLPNFTRYMKEHGPIFSVQLGPEHPMLCFSEPKSIEFLLTNTSILDKMTSYSFLNRWLGRGLLIAGGKEWKKHRKIITPAFHFKILENFVAVFNSAGNILLEKLRNEVGKDSFNICPLLNLFALDVICESSMGVKINAQEAPQSEYVTAVKDMCRIIVDRSVSATKRFNLLYRLSADYAVERRAVHVLHSLSNSVIKARKEEMKEKPQDANVDEFGVKRRNKALLDILLEASQKEEQPLTDDELRQEVDTFMFAGHDTTSTALGYVIYCLANHPDVQEKVREELKVIFSDDPERNETYKDLQDMVYLEQVIKETLRLYPTVPMYGRRVTEDTEYDGIKIPAGTEIAVFAYAVHRDPKIYPDPEAFKPERFADTTNRSPFAYIPFSAGPRNCIGQKFAMLEIKTTVSKIVRNFEICPAIPKHLVKPVSETVLKSRNGVCVRLKARF